MRKSNSPQAPVLLFDADAPTLPNDYQPSVAQVKSGKYRKTNNSSDDIKTIYRHLPNYFSAKAFLSKFIFFPIPSKAFNPEPIAHIYSSKMVNSFWYEYHLLYLLQATQQPARDMLAHIKAHAERIEQANELAKKRGYGPEQTIAQIAKLYKGGMGDVGEATCRAAFGYMGYYADLNKAFLSYKFAESLDGQIAHLNSYLELLDTLPQYEQLPEAQRDEQLRVIFSDYLNLV